MPHRLTISSFAGNRYRTRQEIRSLPVCAQRDQRLLPRTRVAIETTEETISRVEVEEAVAEVVVEEVEEVVVQEAPKVEVDADLCLLHISCQTNFISI